MSLSDLGCLIGCQRPCCMRPCVQVPHTLAGTTWEAEEEGYVRHLLSICDRFAPGTSDLVRVCLVQGLPW